MPYAERVTPTPRGSANKSTSLPMPIAAFHNNEEHKVSSLHSFVRRKCLEYFVDETSTSGRVGLRCTFCNDLSPEEKEGVPRSYVFPRQVVSIHAAVITLMYSHMPYCPEVPNSVLEHIETLKENDIIASENKNKPTLKRYRWADVAHEMGFEDGPDSGIIFVPPETYGRKRQAVQAAFSSSSVSSVSPRSLSPVPAPRADWTNDDDLRLWKGQEELGNKWKEVAEQIFNSTFRGDQVRNRWYCSAFKDFVAAKFGATAYEQAQQAGKQMNNGGQGGSQPAIAWTPDEDMKLWNAQRELGNKWKDISTKFRFDRRNAEQVKTRWYSDKFKDFAAQTFGKDAYRTAHANGKQERQGARPQVEWTREDDKLLWLARQDMGNKWEDISTQQFESRMSDNHVKNRWYSAGFKKFVAEEFGPDAYQNAKIGRRGAQAQVDWTAEDDMMLWKSHSELGNKWQIISEHGFGSRINENQVKNRWYSAPFKKFVAEEFGADAHGNAKHKK